MKISYNFMVLLQNKEHLASFFHFLFSLEHVVNMKLVFEQFLLLDAHARRCGGKINKFYCRCHFGLNWLESSVIILTAGISESVLGKLNEPTTVDFVA